MDANTGDLYRNRLEALKDGTHEDDIVELSGSKEAIDKVASAVREQAKAEGRLKRALKVKERRRMARASRRTNRRG